MHKNQKKQLNIVSLRVFRASSYNIFLTLELTLVINWLLRFPAGLLT
jgi:hypothetical protein